MYFDYYYFILVVPALLFAMWAQKKVKSAFNQYSNASTYSRMTGFEAARRILDAHGLRNVQIEMIDGDLTDHYDPGANVIRLSQRVFSSDSISAIGVAAHEAGHAVQYTSKNKVRNYTGMPVRLFNFMAYGIYRLCFGQFKTCKHRFDFVLIGCGFPACHTPCGI